MEIAQLQDDVALYVWCPTCRDLVEAGELIGGPIGGVVRVDRTCTEQESDEVHAQRQQADLRRAESAESVLAGTLTFGEIRNFIESWTYATPHTYAQRTTRERELYRLWVTLKRRIEKECHDTYQRGKDAASLSRGEHDKQPYAGEGDRDWACDAESNRAGVSNGSSDVPTAPNVASEITAQEPLPAAQTLVDGMLAMEFGFRAAEKGHNLQQATEEFKRLMK